MGTWIGQIIGQYHITEEIGRGGMATVYRARQESIEREVAVKVLHRSLIDQDSNFLERFYREVKAIAHLQHPHILPVHDYGEHDDQPYIVTAFINGGSLADHIRQMERLHLNETAQLVRQMAEALEYAHLQGIIHRDFKPANVLIDQQGNTYLADFGLAKMLGDTDLTATGIVGTPDYMAPDWAEERGLTPAVDVYALGVTVYQMLTGTLPYRASAPMGVLMAHLNQSIPDIREQRPDLPPVMQTIIETALAKNAEERYQSPIDLANALQAVVEDRETDLFKPASTPEPVRKNLFHPNEWARDVFMAAAETLGQEELHAILMMAGLQDYIENMPPANLKNEFSFEQCGSFWRSVYEIYGKRGIQAVGKSAGQYTFNHTLDKHQGIKKVARATTRIGTAQARVGIGLGLMTRMYDRMSDIKVVYHETDRYWIMQATQCPICYGWHADEQVCYHLVGAIQAGLLWLSGGQRYRVVETLCMAKGDEVCEFVINKTPVET